MLLVDRIDLRSEDSTGIGFNVEELKFVIWMVGKLSDLANCHPNLAGYPLSRV